MSLIGQLNQIKIISYSVVRKLFFEISIFDDEINQIIKVDRTKDITIYMSIVNAPAKVD